MLEDGASWGEKKKLTLSIACISSSVIVSSRTIVPVRVELEAGAKRPACALAPKDGPLFGGDIELRLGHCRRRFSCID